MSAKQPDPDDPMELIGVRLPVEDARPLEEMAECFAEEFVRLGLPEAQVLALFKNPFYVGAHDCYRKLGEERIRALINRYSKIFQYRRL